MRIIDRLEARLGAWVARHARAFEERVSRAPARWDYGVVILMDAMGYKGIWRRAPNPDVVMRKLRRLQDRMRYRGRDQLGSGLLGRLRYLSVPRSVEPVLRGISDSTLLLVRLPRDRPEWQDLYLFIALSIAQQVYLDGARLEPRWATRGAMAIGEFVADTKGPFIVGPAVDEAAAAMEASAGAFVMATESAIGPLQSLTERDRRREGFHAAFDLQTVPWRVPMKDKSHRETMVLNPFAMDAAWRRREVTNQILSCFSDEPKVAEYRQNTADFLHHTAGLVEARLRAAREG